MQMRGSKVILHTSRGILFSDWFKSDALQFPEAELDLFISIMGNCIRLPIILINKSSSGDLGNFKAVTSRPLMVVAVGVFH